VAPGADLLAQSGYDILILVRLRPFGVTILIRENVHPGKMPVFYGKTLVFPLVVLTLFWT
jgi:hypothetical protein